MPERKQERGMVQLAIIIVAAIVGVIAFSIFNDFASMTPALINMWTSISVIIFSAEVIALTWKTGNPVVHSGKPKAVAPGASS